MIEKFLKNIVKLEPVEFLGLATFLGVKLLGGDGEPKDFTQLLKELMEKYERLERRKRRDLEKLIRGGKINAPRTKNN